MLRLRPGIKAGEGMRQDVFRVAYDEAQSELLDITVQFEQLKSRKTRLEVAITALAGLCGAEASKTPKGPGPEIVEPAEADRLQEHSGSNEPVSFTFDQVPVPLPDTAETAGDPFQRRAGKRPRFGILSRDENGLQPAV